MAKQLLTDGNINENQLKHVPLKKAQENIGISLLQIQVYIYMRTCW